MKLSRERFEQIKTASEQTFGKAKQFNSELHKKQSRKIRRAARKAMR